MMPGVEEEDEEEDVEEYEDVDQFGPELQITSVEGQSEIGPETEPVSPLSPLPGQEEENPLDAAASTGSVPLTAEALAKLSEEADKKEAEEAVKEPEKTS